MISGVSLNCFFLMFGVSAHFPLVIVPSMNEKCLVRHSRYLSSHRLGPVQHCVFLEYARPLALLEALQTATRQANLNCFKLMQNLTFCRQSVYSRYSNPSYELLDTHCSERQVSSRFHCLKQAKIRKAKIVSRSSNQMV